MNRVSSFSLPNYWLGEYPKIPGGGGLFPVAVAVAVAIAGLLFLSVSLALDHLLISSAPLFSTSCRLPTV